MKWLWLVVGIAGIYFASIPGGLCSVVDYFNLNHRSGPVLSCVANVVGYDGKDYDFGAGSARVEDRHLTVTCVYDLREEK